MCLVPLLVSQRPSSCPQHEHWGKRPHNMWTIYSRCRNAPLLGGKTWTRCVPGCCCCAEAVSSESGEAGVRQQACTKLCTVASVRLGMPAQSQTA